MRRPGLIPLDADALEALAAAARAVHDDAVIALLDVMTPERCALVRRLRVDEHSTWRGVAFECHRAWGASWEPASNQLWGIALCKIAAQAQGEHWDRAPWN